MTTSDKLREIADRYTEDYDRGIGYCPNPERSNELVSDLTALISEGYVEKAKYDEAVRQRDELKEALKQIMFSSGTLKTVQDIAEAAIKNTEG